MQLVVLAGGLGSRAQSTKPKVLYEVGGSTLLRKLILNASQSSRISEILFILGHNAERILDAIEQDSVIKKEKIIVSTFVEQERLGTLGALVQAKDFLKDNFIVVSGDLYLEFDFAHFVEYVISKNSDFISVVHPNGHSYDSDGVFFDLGSKQITEFKLKKETGIPVLSSLAGVYSITKRYLINLIEANQTSGDLIEALAKYWRHSSNFRNAHVYETLEYIKDSGTPERRELIERHETLNIPKNRSRRTEKKALFVDKDNTLVRDLDANQIPTHDTIKEIGRMNESFTPIVGISNQPAIAKGKIATLVFRDFARLAENLDKENAFIDAWYICPHHPDSGFIEENRFFKVTCRCRKPKTGLFEYAKEDHNLDLNGSIMIGDSLIDFRAASDTNMTFFHTTEYVTCDFSFSHFCFEKTAAALKEARGRLCKL